MKTETSNTDIIMRQLSSATINLPVAQLLSELQVVVERLSFSGLVYREDSRGVLFMGELDSLFDGEISNSMLDFLHWLSSTRILGILTGRTGHLFLGYCNKIYGNVKEIKFITSIELSPQYQSQIVLKLRTLYPLPARIVCEVSPSLKAGFIIKDNSKIIDLSLKSRMEKNIKTYVDYHASNDKVLNV